MAKRDYYEVLGIQKDASENDIKKSYRKLAKQFHPDRNPDDPQAEEKFKEASEAYEILSDPEKRKRYDIYGHEGVRSAFSSGGFSWNDFHHFDDFQDIFSGIFDSFFGGMRGQRQSAMRGRDLRFDLEINLEEAITGKEETINVNRLEKCDTCGGSGAKPGTGPTVCPRCNGRGNIRIAQGFFSINTTCDICRGNGKILKDPCQKCDGEGRMPKQVRVRVNIPKGIDDGQRIRLSGEGEAGRNNAPNGDLYIVIHIKPHSLYTREGEHLYYELPITFSQAALGDEVEVPTVYGSAKLKIPPSTQTHTIFKLKEYGMPILNSKDKGNLFIRTIVTTPRKISKEQKELFTELAKLSNQKITPTKKSFFEKSKDFLEGFVK